MKKIKRKLFLFVTLFLLSGFTAFPLEWEGVFVYVIDNGPEFLIEWVTLIYTAIHETKIKYPFMAYGTDWVFFAHLVISLFFIAPIKDPIKNIAAIKAGIIACALVFPYTFIFGYLRGIPIYWRIMDCAFGLFGFIILYSAYTEVKKIKNETT